YPVISEQQKIIALLKNICNLIAANEQVPKLVIKIVKNFLANSLHLN
ncbi:restriction endonuclease subunit S, partial [Lactiplantibacillus plantarum]